MARLNRITTELSRIHSDTITTDRRPNPLGVVAAELVGKAVLETELRVRGEAKGGSLVDFLSKLESGSVTPVDGCDMLNRDDTEQTVQNLVVACESRQARYEIRPVKQCQKYLDDTDKCDKHAAHMLQRTTDQVMADKFGMERVRTEGAGCTP